MPADDEWDRAQEAWTAAEQALAAAPQPSVPQPVRDAVAALGNLLSVRQGYGDAEAMDWDNDG
jgi:hypothetical protein